MPSPPAKPPSQSKPQAMTGPQKALAKLGLRRAIDLALHLPLRYEDETRIVPIQNTRDGDTAQIEGQVTHSEVTFQPRRQLRVTLDDGTDTCVLRSPVGMTASVRCPASTRDTTCSCCPRKPAKPNRRCNTSAGVGEGATEAILLP